MLLNRFWIGVSEKMLLVGIDSVEIKRISKSLENESFLKAFSADELNELQKRGFPHESAAACFAAKEAFGKAIGLGIFSYPLSDVSLVHEPNGRPVIVTNGKAAELEIVKNHQFSVSITHTADVATAIVIGQPV